MSSMMNSMMSTAPLTSDMDMPAMQRCVEACSACSQACVMCADLSGDGMRMSSAMCLNTADMAHTMMRLLMRPAAMHPASVMAMAEAMIVAANACAAECMRHADHYEYMRTCAQACTECANACQALLPMGHGTGPA